MTFLTSRTFDKKIAKVRESVYQSFVERLELFAQEPFHPLLRNHPLSGTYQGCRSINVTGDYRLIFTQIDHQTIRLIDIDTHHNLYGT